MGSRSSGERAGVHHGVVGEQDLGAEPWGSDVHLATETNGGR
jgi:hypothetical protein